MQSNIKKVSIKTNAFWCFFYINTSFHIQAQGTIGNKVPISSTVLLFTVYDDRIVITSPGPMASGVLINKELNNNIPSIRRNPILADIFARMKFMDRRGSGFNKIVNGTNRLFDDNKNYVEFYATETHFSVVIYNANYNNVENGVTNGVINDVINGALNEN